ncbi:MAG: M15 family metallopeptidase [Flavobacteriales bacterium]|nr:M15 family metallopeptidase [Flavobacteriales bacterium]
MRIIPIFLFLLMSCTVFGQPDPLDYIMGKVNYAEDDRFAKIPSSIANKEGMYLRKEALEAFQKMRKAAAEDGITLRIMSAARSFNHQKQIWEGKWNGNRLVDGKNMKTAISDPAERARFIMKYSSMPGTSRHHWGTDIDINSFNPDYFDSGRGQKEYQWLVDNAHRFGFCQTYTEKDKERPHGYEEEKWHWTYMPIAKPLLTFFKNNVTGADMKGFDGAGSIPFEEVQKYVFGISKECQ